jgi:hypothetical protein
MAEEDEEDSTKISQSIYSVFIYALMYSIIFIYLQEDIGYNMVLIILVIIHVLFGMKANELVSNVTSNNENINFLISIIPVIVIGSLIVRTISLAYYTFGYTNAVIKSYNLGDKYDPPKKYKVREENYKFSYFVSTICLFIIYFIYLIYLIYGDKLVFNLEDFDETDVFSIVCMIGLGILMLYDVDFNSFYQQSIYTLITIISIMVLFLLAIVIHPHINGYFIPTVFTIISGLIGYFVDLGVNKNSDMVNEGRVYGSLSGFLFSMIGPYLPIVGDAFERDRMIPGNKNAIFVLINTILGFTGATMVTTSVFEMIDAIEYEKYHSKINKYKKKEESEDDVLEKKQNEIISTVINILVFIICAILIFVILIYALGISGQNLLFAGIFSLLLTSYFSYNSFISSIIGTQFKY